MSPDVLEEEGTPQKPPDAGAAPAAAPAGDAPSGPTLAGVLATAWLVLLGLLATVVGGHDAVAGREISVRLLGSLVLAAGVMLLVGAVGLHRRQALGLTLAMIAALLGVAIGVMMFLAQVVNDEPDRRLILWGLMIVLSVAAAVYVRACTPRAERSRSIWSRLPILKSAISFGVLVSAVQFWYSLIYLPTTSPASVNLESKIDDVSTRGGQLVVRASVTIRNTSDIRINVLASTLDLTGERLAAHINDSKTFTDDINRADKGELSNADRYVSEKKTSRVTHGRLVADGVFLEPHEVIVVPILTWVPKGPYNTLYLDAWMSIARGNVLGVQDATPHVTSTRKGVVVLTSVPEAGWLRGLTRGDRYVRVQYRSESEYTTPDVSFAPNRSPKPSKGFDDRLRRFYGVSETTSEAVASLP